MSGAEHPRHRLNELIHQPVRFSIMASLAAADWLDFRDLRDALQITDSALSKQMTTLDDAGFIDVKKAFVGKRPRTSFRLTKEGRAAWVEHLTTLREIAGA